MRLISFWGKGGVGKTTCAAALATNLSEEKSVLLITNDPTPTLSDILETNLSAEPSKVPGYTNLYAAEIDEEAVIDMWKSRFGEEVYYILSSFLPVERDIIDYIARAPGISDQFMLYVIYELWRSDRYDLIIWDTPASSGSLRLLRLEREMYSHLSDAVKMYLRLKGFLNKIRRGEGDPLTLINEWKLLAENIFAMLSNPDHELNLVTIPEKMAFQVTNRLHSELREMGINTSRVIVNMVLDPNVCKSCDPWARKVYSQQEILKRFNRIYGNVLVIPNVSFEPIGREGLLRFSRFLLESF
ncbi:MAG: ArsA family ATPase [Candidatus Korarchaeota archaeon]|nr:ArsA family ATPase [Candidatus Korarchaeota archaeon]